MNILNRLIITPANNYGYSDWAIKDSLSTEIKELKKRLPETALTKKKVKPSYYQDTPAIVAETNHIYIKNQTNFQITFNEDTEIFINEIPLIDRKFHHNTQLIAYQIKRHPNLICFETNRKIDNDLVKSRMILDLSEAVPQIRIDEENRIYRLSERDIFIDKAVCPLVSFFDKNNIPRDILLAIALQYERCIQSEIDQLNIK